MPDGINPREQLLAEVEALRTRVKDRETRSAMVEEDAVRKSEEKYRLLFHSTPIALLERDAPRLKTYLDHLRESGVADFEAYLRDDHQETAHCMSLIKIAGS